MLGFSMDEAKWYVKAIFWILFIVLIIPPLMVPGREEAILVWMKGTYPVAFNFLINKWLVLLIPIAALFIQAIFDMEFMNLQAIVFEWDTWPRMEIPFVLYFIMGITLCTWNLIEHLHGI